MLNRFTILLLMFVLLSAVQSHAEVVSKVAAVVNDAIITTHQLETKFNEALDRQPAGSSLDVAGRDKLRRQLLDKLIEEMLVEDRVRQLRLKVSEEDIDAAVADVQQNNNLTREQLLAALQQQGMDFATYRESLRKQILRFKLISVEVRSKAEVTSAEVREYYREHLDDYREPPFMHLGRLTFPLSKGADTATIDAVRSLAVEAREKLEQGAEVSTLLMTYATSNVDGGDMGSFRVGELSGIFDRAVRDLETGEVSEVVETPSGFFIFRMIERSSGDEKPFEDVSAEIEQILVKKKQDQAFEEWNKSLREDAYIDIRI